MHILYNTGPLYNTSLLRVPINLTPQEHIVILLIIQVAIQDVEVVRGQQFGSRDTALNTQCEGEPRCHDYDLLEILDQFSTLPINSIQYGESVLQHLTVLEERHFREHHLDGETGRKFDEYVTLQNQRSILFNPIIYIIEGQISFIEFLLEHTSHVLEYVYVLQVLHIIGVLLQDLF